MSISASRLGAFLASSTLLIFSVGAFGQRFSPAQCKEEMAFVKHQLFAVHAYPYTELTKAQFEHLFDSIGATMTDSLSVAGLYCKIKPVMGYLSDEHANIDMPKALADFGGDSAFLPFNLKEMGGRYFVDTVFGPYAPGGLGPGSPGSLRPGEEILAIDDQPIAKAVSQAAQYMTGYPFARAQLALRQFGYAYGLSVYPRHTFNVQSNRGSISVSGITVTAWTDFQHGDWNGAHTGIGRITYTRYGAVGYIHANSFLVWSDKDASSLIDSVKMIFHQIHADGVKRLIIDVSYNNGGASVIGDCIIGEICSKPYLDYQCDFKRSDEYVALVRHWGFTPDSHYVALAPGAVQHFGSDTVWPGNPPDRFEGKVYVLIGSGTFSSAIMFGTIIKDNAIATLVGQTPIFGHPSDFGEVYNTKLPYSQIILRFGVKHWIRPAGLAGPNVLTPDIALGLDQTSDPETLIKALP